MNTRSLLLIVPAFALWGCEGPQGPAGNGVESMSDPSVQPAVIYTYPPNNSSGPFQDLYTVECGLQICEYFSQFQIRFNKFMDISSVRRAVRLSSPAGDIFADTTHIASVGGDVFVVSPVDANGSRYAFRFEIGEPYTIGVDSTATDINGNPLKPPFTATFVPEPHFRVSGTEPRDGDSSTQVAMWIRLRFNSPVTSSILNHLTSTPALPGGWQFSADSRTILTPTFSGPLSSSTTYRIMLDDGAEDAHGKALNGPYTLKFRTADFGLSHHHPRNGASAVPPAALIEFIFTIPIDTSGTPGSVHVTPATPGVVAAQVGSSYMTFTPTFGLRPETAYTVVLDSTITAVDGTGLGQAHSFSFTTDRIRVMWTYPADGGLGVSRVDGIWVETNSTLSDSSVLSSVLITPSAGFTISHFNKKRGFIITPTTPLEGRTLYTVTIDSTLECLTGDNLAAPYQFSFTTW